MFMFESFKLWLQWNQKFKGFLHLGLRSKGKFFFKVYGKKLKVTVALTEGRMDLCISHSPFTRSTECTFCYKEVIGKKAEIAFNRQHFFFHCFICNTDLNTPLKNVFRKGI